MTKSKVSEKSGFILTNEMKLQIKDCLREAKEILDKIDTCDYINYLHGKHLDVDSVEVKRAIQVDIKRWNDTKTVEFRRFQRLTEILCWLVDESNYMLIEGDLHEILKANVQGVSEFD